METDHCDHLTFKTVAMGEDRVSVSKPIMLMNRYGNLKIGLSKTGHFEQFQKRNRN